MTITSKVRATLGETLVAILLATVVALLLAVAGFVGAVAFCQVVFTGEATESGLVLAPLAAIVVGITAFFLVYRWFVRYGNPPSDNA